MIEKVKKEELETLNTYFKEKNIEGKQFLNKYDQLNTKRNLFSLAIKKEMYITMINPTQLQKLFKTLKKENIQVRISSNTF